jgi:hypothetical protein
MRPKTFATGVTVVSKGLLTHTARIAVRRAPTDSPLSRRVLVVVPYTAEPERLVKNIHPSVSSLLPRRACMLVPHLI